MSQKPTGKRILAACALTLTVWVVEFVVGDVLADLSVPVRDTSSVPYWSGVLTGFIWFAWLPRRNLQELDT